MDGTIRIREDAIRQVTRILPGSRAYVNRIPIKVPQSCDGLTLIGFLSQTLPFISLDEWQSLFAANTFQHQGQDVGPSRIVRSGERYVHIAHATREPDVNPDIRVLHEDDSIVVVDKPAPLPMHPCGRFNRNTLIYILRQVYAPTQIRIAHRLDADTSGVVILTKTRQAASRVQAQFAKGRVTKSYLARVLGTPDSERFDCDAPVGISAAKPGIRIATPDGKPARTEFQVVRHLEDETTLVEAQPTTGRTNQIRLHLWHRGLPIQGDPIYKQNGELGSRQTLTPRDPPMCLHALRVEISHPETQQRAAYEASFPAWADQNLS